MSLPQDQVTRRPITLHDSADDADERFRRLRDSLNVDARMMQDGDRHSLEYHRQFDDSRRRILAADSMRTTRDRMRARILRSAPASGALQSTVRATILAAKSPDGRRAIVRKVVGGDSVTLDLSPRRMADGGSASRDATLALEQAGGCTHQPAPVTAAGRTSTRSADSSSARLTLRESPGCKAGAAIRSPPPLRVRSVTS